MDRGTHLLQESLADVEFAAEQVLITRHEVNSLLLSLSLSISSGAWNVRALTQTHDQSIRHFNKAKKDLL